MTAIDAGVLLGIVGALVTFYKIMNDKANALLVRQDKQAQELAARQDKIEDCVEDQIGELSTQLRFFREAQRDFQEGVLSRLSSIETHLRGGIGDKRK